MIEPIDIRDEAVAERIVEIQIAAYAVEAELMGFDGIPQLHETVPDARSRTDLWWFGVYDGGEIIGAIAWREQPGLIDIDRLVIAPSHARRGYGRNLVMALGSTTRITVSTGAANAPARALYESLGFELIGTSEIAPSVRVVHYEKPGDSTTDPS